MKSLIQAVALAAVFAVPAASFAQSNSPVTRAQVRAELEELEKVGYHVGDGDNTNYPDAIQAAEARVAAAKGNTGYGGAVSGTSQTGGGAKVSPQDWNAMYSR